MTRRKLTELDVVTTRIRYRVNEVLMIVRLTPTRVARLPDLIIPKL